MHGHGEEFQAGIDVLGKLTTGKVHLNIRSGSGTSKVFTNSKNVQINTFQGPHPAGLVSNQVQHLCPLNRGEVVWYLYPQDVMIIGKLFLSGKYEPVRLVALTGSEVLKPKYYRTLSGAQILAFVSNNTTSVKKRYVSGNVLTGTQVEKPGYLGFYDTQISVLPEGNAHEFLGWALPGFGKFSMSRSYFSWLTPTRKYCIDTNLHGGHRAFVMTGEFEKVFPLDIYPLQLIKAILVGDIDLMEQLGIYEVDAEDFALCEVIDCSKNEIQRTVKEGLELMRKEMS